MAELGSRFGLVVREAAMGMRREIVIGFNGGYI